MNYRKGVKYIPKKFKSQTPGIDYILQSAKIIAK